MALFLSRNQAELKFWNSGMTQGARQEPRVSVDHTTGQQQCQPLESKAAGWAGQPPPSQPRSQPWGWVRWAIGGSLLLHLWGRWGADTRSNRAGNFTILLKKNTKRLVCKFSLRAGHFSIFSIIFTNIQTQRKLHLCSESCSLPPSWIP